MFDFQEIPKLMIISFILITSTFCSRGILWGKIGSQSLLWVKGLILKIVFNMLVCLSSFWFKCWKSNVNVFCSFSRTITRDDLVEYISKHYSAPRMVLAAAGGKFFLPYSILFFTDSVWRSEFIKRGSLVSCLSSLHCEFVLV